jgi:hypothetical protein
VIALNVAAATDSTLTTDCALHCCISLSQLLRTTGDTVSQPIAIWPCELVITVSGLIQEAYSAQALQQAAVLKLSPFEVSIAIEGHHRYSGL